MEQKIENEQEQLRIEIKELERLIKVSNEAKTIYEKEISHLDKIKLFPEDEKYLAFCHEELERIIANIHEYNSQMRRHGKRLARLQNRTIKNSEAQPFSE